MLNKGIRTDEYVKLSAWCAAVAAVKNICGINQVTSVALSN